LWYKQRKRGQAMSFSTVVVCEVYRMVRVHIGSRHVRRRSIMSNNTCHCCQTGCHNLSDQYPDPSALKGGWDEATARGTNPEGGRARHRPGLAVRHPPSICRSMGCGSVPCNYTSKYCCTSNQNCTTIMGKASEHSRGGPHTHEQHYPPFDAVPPN
jgi:hypothetical protein